MWEGQKENVIKDVLSVVFFVEEEREKIMRQECVPLLITELEMRRDEKDDNTVCVSSLISLQKEKYNYMTFLIIIVGRDWK